jgi:CRP-like cAMP-binding protein
MDELGEAERKRLLERFGRSFDAGQTVYSEGDPAEQCFLVQEGRVRLLKRIRSTERSLTILRKGDLFGEDALLDGTALRGATAVALNEVVVLALDRKTFGALLTGNPEVAGRLVTQLVRRLRDAEEQLENATLRDHPSRVVNTLVRLAGGVSPGPEGHVLAVTPLELAARVGLDVDAVKRAVGQLRDGGYLKIAEERIVLPDLDALKRLYRLLGMKEEVRTGLP